MAPPKENHVCGAPRARARQQDPAGNHHVELRGILESPSKRSKRLRVSRNLNSSFCGSLSSLSSLASRSSDARRLIWLVIFFSARVVVCSSACFGEYANTVRALSGDSRIVRWGLWKLNCGQKLTSAARPRDCFLCASFLHGDNFVRVAVALCVKRTVTVHLLLLVR